MTGPGQPDISDKTCLIPDFGLFSGLAEAMAGACKVKYFVPWQDAYPQMSRFLVGQGIPNSEKVLRLFEHMDEADFIYCPDNTWGDFVTFFRRLGYNICGASQRDEMLELDRIYGRRIQRQAGLPTQGTSSVVGVSNLMRWLKEHPGPKFIKIDVFRGEVETFRHSDLEQTALVMNRLRLEMGPFADEPKFIIEEPIPDSPDGVSPIEGGLDTFVFNGQTLSPTMMTYVGEDVLITKIMDYRDIPEPYRLVHDRLAPIFAQFQTRCPFSTEIMWNGEEGYLLDYTMRSAIPMLSTMQSRVITNFPEVIYSLATGSRVDPEVDEGCKYAGSYVMSGPWAVDNWDKILADPDVQPHITYRFHARRGKSVYRVPAKGMGDQECAVVAVGGSVEEVIGKLERYEGKVSFMQKRQAMGIAQEINRLVDKSAQLGIPF